MKLLNFFVTKFILVLLIVNPHLFSQSKNTGTICGHITDRQTGEPIFNVNIFLENTTRGTISGIDGRFCLENIPVGSYNLIVRHIGYELISEPVLFFTAEHLTKDFHMEPRLFEGEIVQVTARVPKQWNKNLKKFTKQFIGNSKYARDCKLLNPEVLDFKKDRDRQLFFASTDSLLHVENRVLGFRAFIVLKVFEWNERESQLTWSFSARFEEMKARSKREERTWRTNRRANYEGSFKHFIASLARHRLEEEKYYIYHTGSPKIRANAATDMVSSDADTYVRQMVVTPFGRSRQIKNYRFEILSADRSGLQQFSFDNLLNVIHIKNGRKDSWMRLLESRVLIDTLGNCYTSLPIRKWGYWSEARIADLLPFDYVP